jgi:hypothetical protein
MDDVLHTEAKSEVTWQHVLHRAEVEERRLVGRALLGAAQALDRLAQRALVEALRTRVGAVDVAVALLLGAKAEDEIRFCMVEVGNPDRVLAHQRHHRSERRIEFIPRGRSAHFLDAHQPPAFGRLTLLHRRKRKR